eukprot:4041523-Prymnesium_polylepis.2
MAIERRMRVSGICQPAGAHAYGWVGRRAHRSHEQAWRARQHCCWAEAFAAGVVGGAVRAPAWAAGGRGTKSRWSRRRRNGQSRAGCAGHTPSGCGSTACVGRAHASGARGARAAPSVRAPPGPTPAVCCDGAPPRQHPS